MALRLHDGRPSIQNHVCHNHRAYKGPLYNTPTTAITDSFTEDIMDKKSSRALMLILTTFTYLLLGAAVFDMLESETERYMREEIAFIREKLQQKDLQLFESIAIKGVPHKAGFQWQFSGAFYFATVVITTVGYGHAAPETIAGRFFCMIFALAGIPLGLIMFQSIGERVNTFIAFCLHRLRSILQARGINCLREVTPTHLLIVSFSIGSCIIFIVSTIGFGDLVPLQQGSALQIRPFYVVFTLLFILLGLAVFSACVNLLVLRFMAPNADVVTASAKEPHSTIVFERFARSSSLVDSQLFSLRRLSKERASILGFAQIPRHLSILGKSTAVEKIDPNQCTNLCTKCRQPRRRRLNFSLTRPPTEHIEHLVCSDKE